MENLKEVFLLSILVVLTITLSCAGFAAVVKIFDLPMDDGSCCCKCGDQNE